MSDVQFHFESDRNGGYVGVLANSELVPGPIVSQNAGSTNPGIYYQVGGSGLNGAFANALGDEVPAVNKRLQAAYDVKFGSGRWDTDSRSLRTPLPLTSFLVPVNPSASVGDSVVGMVYSVGPKLTSKGLTASECSRYSQIYTDAMSEIARSEIKISSFRITMLSSGIYRGNAPIAEFSHAAAGCIIDAILTSIRAEPVVLSQLAILINSNSNADYAKERVGFTSAATDFGASLTTNGFSISISTK